MSRVMQIDAGAPASTAGGEADAPLQTSKQVFRANLAASPAD